MTSRSVVRYDGTVKAWRVWVPGGALSHIVHGVTWYAARQRAALLFSCDPWYVRLVPF